MTDETINIIKSSYMKNTEDLNKKINKLENRNILEDIFCEQLINKLKKINNKKMNDILSLETDYYFE